MRFTKNLRAAILLAMTLACLATAQTPLDRKSVEKELFKLALQEADRCLLNIDFNSVVKLGPEAIPILLEIFSDESYAFGSTRSLAYPIRLLAGIALAEFKPQVLRYSEVAFATLRRLQNHRKRDVQEIALAALYRLGDEKPLKLKTQEGYAKIQQKHTQLEFYNKQGATILVQRLRYDLAVEYHELAIFYLRIHDKQRGKELLLQAIVFEPAAYASYYNLACAYASLGEIEKGVDALAQAVETGYADLSWLQRDQDLQSLHAHPKFAQIVQKLTDSLSQTDEQ
jgi:tetratricopeptide (TPR) repeat protein